MQPKNEKAIGFKYIKQCVLRSLLDLAEDDESRVFFKGFKQYNDLVLDLAEELVEAEFALEITTDKKDINNIK